MASLKDDVTYTLYINSTDKISGNNNNANYYVQFNSFLPTTYDKYNIKYIYKSNTGNYTDVSNNFVYGTIGNSYTNYPLNANMTISDTVITMISSATAQYTSNGFLLIDNEIISYTGVTSLTFTGCTRGVMGTTPASHSSGTLVYGLKTNNSFSCSNCQLLINMNCKKYSLDTATQHQSLKLGFIDKVQLSTTTPNNYFNCKIYDNPIVTIERPTIDNINIQIYNNNNNMLLYDVKTVTLSSTTYYYLSSDMTNYSMIIEFTPVKESINNTSFNV